MTGDVHGPRLTCAVGRPCSVTGGSWFPSEQSLARAPALHPRDFPDSAVVRPETFALQPALARPVALRVLRNATISLATPPSSLPPARRGDAPAGRLGAFFRWGILLPALAVAAPPDLLREAAAHWLDERDHWAFTQLVREYDGDQLKRERLERYDPSRPDSERWELIRLDGRAPTAKEKSDLTERKNKKRRKHTKAVADYFDFNRAVLLREDARTVRYELPLRSNNAWLFPIEKVALTLEIDKPTRAITQVQARIEEPFRVALGLARVLDVDFDLQTALPPSDAPTPDPAAAKPNGTARAVVTKLGDRVEYEWSDFQRVTPHPDRQAAPPK